MNSRVRKVKFAAHVRKMTPRRTCIITRISGELRLSLNASLLICLDNNH